MSHRRILWHRDRDEGDGAREGRGWRSERVLKQ